MSVCVPLTCCSAIFYQLLWLTLESTAVRKSHLSLVFPIHIQTDYFTQISLRFEVKRGCFVQHLPSLGQALLPFYLNLSCSLNARVEKLIEVGKKREICFLHFTHDSGRPGALVRQSHLLPLV
ncbi:uncharacterized [Tachysurus ichikawai]